MNLDDQHIPPRRRARLVVETDRKRPAFMHRRAHPLVSSPNEMIIAVIGWRARELIAGLLPAAIYGTACAVGGLILGFFFWGTR